MPADLQRIHDALAAELSRIADAVIVGTITPDQAFDMAAKAIKRAHIQAAIAGHQAAAQSKFEGLLRRILDIIAPLRDGLSDVVKSELEYLKNFINEIADGTQSDAQIKNRFNQYADGINKTYHEAERTVQGRSGMTEERRIINPGESCDDCVVEAGKGWQPIGSLRAIGDSQCGSRCNCEFQYR